MSSRTADIFARRARNRVDVLRGWIVGSGLEWRAGFWGEAQGASFFSKMQQRRRTSWRRRCSCNCRCRLVWIFNWGINRAIASLCRSLLRATNLTMTTRISFRARLQAENGLTKPFCRAAINQLVRRMRWSGSQPPESPHQRVWIDQQTFNGLVKSISLIGVAGVHQRRNQWLNFRKAFAA